MFLFSNRLSCSQGKIPNESWSDASIEHLLNELSMMDSNNFPHNVGVGEREARIFSGNMLHIDSLYIIMLCYWLCHLGIRIHPMNAPVCVIWGDWCWVHTCTFLHWDYIGPTLCFPTLGKGGWVISRWYHGQPHWKLTLLILLSALLVNNHN